MRRYESTINRTKVMKVGAYKVIDMWLTKNPYSRPGKKLKSKKAIVIHWVANPNTSAKANRDFFESRKGGTKSYGSAHEIIDLDGDVIRCIPEDEMAYHVGSNTYTKEALTRLSSYPNDCTYGIECTHVDWEGRMTTETYETLIQRCADLCKAWGLNPMKDLWLHKEVVGWKDCHRWFVNNPDEWVKFKQLVASRMIGKKEAEEMIEMALAQWQKEMGEKAVDELASKGLVSNPKDWKAKLAEPTPNWLLFEMLRRLNDRIERM